MPLSVVSVRPLERADLARALALNEASVEVLSPLDAQELARLVERCSEALAAELDGRFCGFALALAPRAGYESENYRYFEQRRDSFLYLDRVVVDAGARRQGVASALYDRVEAASAPFGATVCEVDLEPPNDASLAFHAGRGYRPCGRRVTSSGKTLVYLERPTQPE